MPGCSRFGGPLSGALDEAAKLRHDCVYIFRPHTTKRQRVEPAGFVVGNFYLNMLPGEKRSHRHVCWDELLPDACESAVFTVCVGICRASSAVPLYACAEAHAQMSMGV